MALVAGEVSLPLVYTIAFLLGTAETLFDTASEAVIPALVESDQLDSANGRLQAAEWSANSFVGPPLGAALFALAASLPFLFDAASFMVAALFVTAIGGSFRSEGSPDRDPPALRREIAEGLRWLWGHRVLRTLAVMAGITNLVGTGIMAIFVLFAQDILKVGDIGYGVILTTVGVGGLLGSLAASTVAKRLGPGTALLATLAVMAVASVIVGVTSNAVVAAAMTGVFGLAIAQWNVVAVSLRQRLTPDPLRGRVASVARLLAWGTQPLGALLGGAVASTVGLRAPFFVAGAVWLAMLVVVLPVVSNRSIAALSVAD
jgi:predicted MFS family arabinose efflux permease